MDNLHMYKISAERWTLLASLYYACFMSHIELLYHYLDYKRGGIFEVAHSYACTI